MTSRTRPLALALVAGFALLVTSLALVVAPPGGPPPADAATRVDKQECGRIDPNLVNGACLRYATPEGSGLTWIGTYRAPDGRVFFCIDFLYDSRLPRHAERVSTDDLVNQLGADVGDAEVAALNYVVSTWAGRGSTGSDARDAAIALIVREVMGDGRRPGGLVVYPSGLRVGGVVRPPVGGLDGGIMRLANAMWRQASAMRGPWTMRLERVGTGVVRLGDEPRYRLSVRSAAGRRVPGARVRFTCTGPVRCPRAVTTRRRASVVPVRLVDTGRYRIVAETRGPSSDGVLYRQRGWSTHDGPTARPAGVQRGWIAQSTRAWASVAATARVRIAVPEIETTTSAAQVEPGVEIHDVVTVTGLPPGYDRTVVAELHGPFPAPPDADDCTPETRFARNGTRVRRDGTYRTPSVTVPAVGYWTWVQRLPRDRDTVAVTTPCGLVEETTRVVPRRPQVATRVSDRRALVGDRLHDRIRISGLVPTDVVDVAWTLHGPVVPRTVRSRPSCDGVRWSGAPVAATGTVRQRGSGVVPTRRVRPRTPGCYTYSVAVAATPTTEAASSSPGLVSETSLLTRPVTPEVPEVPSGHTTLAGAVGPRRTVAERDPSPYVPQRRAVPRYLTTDYRSPARAGRATGVLEVQGTGLRVGVVPVASDRGTMAVPERRDRMGWLRTTAAHGDLIGSSVLSGHVGGLTGLERARRGDVVRWTADGETVRYVVREVHRYPRRRGLPASLFRTDGRPTIHLVTCAGPQRAPSGDVYFTDNLVVTAVAVR